MLFSFLDTLLKLPNTTSPQKLFTYDCVTLYVYPEFKPDHTRLYKALCFWYLAKCDFSSADVVQKRTLASQGT